MHKILIITMILLPAMVAITTRAGASPAILPGVSDPADPRYGYAPEFPLSGLPADADTEKMLTSSSTNSERTGSDGVSPASSVRNTNLLQGTQHLGELASISWNTLDVVGDQTALSSLLNLPAYNEAWAQFIAREDCSQNPANIAAIHTSIGQSTSLDEMLYHSNIYPMEEDYCLTCHGLSQLEYPTSNGIPNLVTIRSQNVLDPIIQCQVCHMQSNVLTDVQIRGDE